jgi:deoxyribonuclease-4
MAENKILIGPAGTGGAELENFEQIKKLGLDAVEIEFTYGVWMKKEQAIAIKELNKKLGLRLSIHAPYFINLNSQEKQKVGASRSRILASCEIGHYLAKDSKNKTNIVFHPGFYQKDSKETTYNNIKEQILKIQEEIKEKGWNINLCPETTGKASQFGDLYELLQLMKDTKCHICVDFSHLKARYNGKIDYEEIMKKLEPISEQERIHAHFSGIEYTEKGERKHIPIVEKEVKELFAHLKKHNVEVTIICEAPSPLEDAIKMKKLLESMK